MKKSIILFAGFLALTGCFKDPDTSQGREIITVQASIGTMTKVSYDGNGSAFASGDQIAVYVWTGDASAVPASRVVDGVVNTFDGSAWTSASPMRWKSRTVAHYFLGVSPVRSIASFTEDAFSLTPGDYTASDLLVATNTGGVTASGGPVALEFSHAMAKLDVNLNFRSEFGGTPAVSSVTVIAKTAATVNYLTKAVTATGDASEVSLTAEASAPTGYALSFSGLQVPQEGVRKVTVSIGGNEYVYESATDIPLVSGQYTTLGLVVGKDKIELNSISVSDWTAGTDLAGGEAMPFTPPALGDLFYSDGTWSPTLVEGKTPIGVIAYLGTDAFTETGTNVGGSTFTGHGLVLCLKNAASNVCWSTETGFEFPGQEVTDVDGLKRSTNVSGFTNTVTLAAKADAATKYPAAYQARNYSALPAPAGTTGWFLPSAQQWVRMMTGLGGLEEGIFTWDSYFDTNHSGADKWEAALAKAGEKGSAYDSVTDAWLWYWTSSESTALSAVALAIDATGTGSYYGFGLFNGPKDQSADEKCRFRPILAF